jgi:aminoglycoside 3-N-acetyltransferase
MIVDGLRACDLDASSAVIVHSSLRAFGHVDGGALTVCQALLDVCGTVVMPAGSWDLTGVPAPPGLVRPHNAVRNAVTWDEFDAALERAVPFTLDLPIDQELGRIPETMRRHVPHRRSMHPLLSYLAAGQHADTVITTQRLDWPLGPIEALAALGGTVLLLGVDHTANTAIHLAEQRLGRSRFYRYAKIADGAWAELPNIPGQSHRFDTIAPLLEEKTRKSQVGNCRMRCVPIADVLAAATALIQPDPMALLCQVPECRCGAAHRQRLAWVERYGEVC